MHIDITSFLKCLQRLVLRSIYHIIIVILLVISKPSFAQEFNQVNDIEELAALNDFYIRANGANWQNNENWLRDVNQDNQINALDFPFWFGLQVENGDVVGINLPDNNLEGTLSSRLNLLKRLSQISLANNHLKGSIPVQWESLENLTQIDLANNHLDGLLPTAFRNSLLQLKIQDNRFTFQDLEPFFFQNISIPEFLYIPQQDLGQDTVIFVQVGDTLRLINQSFNSPNTLSRWQKWVNGRFVDQFQSNGGLLLFNDFTRADTGVYRLRAFNLIVPGLELFEAPVTLALDTTARPFDEGQVSDSQELIALTAFFNATNGSNWQRNEGWLQDINQDGILNNLDFEEWQGVQTREGDVVNLIFEGATGIDGFLPSEITLLSQLNNFTCQFENLQGTLPLNIDELKELRTLVIQNTALGGQIPPALGSLTKLKTLILENIALQGSIPPEIGNLVALEQLSIAQTQVTGNIPPEITNLSSLKILRLSNDSLGGEIPSAIGDLINLTSLSIAGYRIGGIIPSSIENLTNVNSLSITNTQISGSIPLAISRLSQLLTLNLGQNQLEGSIPSALGQLTQLSLLFLNHNQLDGIIPAELGQLINLNGLDLGNNQLTGIIPAELGQLENLFSLHLNDNHLQGSIPSALGQLSALASLNLSGNRLEETIPSEIGQLKGLIFLELQNNRLTGSIPSNMIQLEKAFIINVSDNQLSGRIPMELKDLNSNLHIDLNFFEFNDIAPLLQFPRNLQVSYIPQKEVGFPKNIVSFPGDTLELLGAIDGDPNTTDYQWEKKVGDVFEAIPTANNLNLLFRPLNPSDSGTYRLRASNQAVPGLILLQAPVHLKVDSAAGVDIDNFILIDPTTDEMIGEFVDGDSIVLNNLADRSIAIRVLTQDRVESVAFILSGPRSFRNVENVAPYSLFGNEGNDFLGNELDPGEYHLQARPYARDNAKGVAGVAQHIRFSVIQMLEISECLLINTEADTILRPLMNLDTIDLARDGSSLSILALTNPEEVGSVRFSLNADSSFNLENKAPYALGKNLGGDFFPTDFGLGEQVLRVTPFSRANGRGDQGLTKEIRFVVINSEADERLASPLLVFPNISTGRIRVQSLTSNLGAGKLEIRDAQGRMIYMKDFKEHLRENIHLTQAGYYILRVSSPKGYWVKRILVRK